MTQSSEPRNENDYGKRRSLERISEFGELLVLSIFVEGFRFYQESKRMVYDVLRVDYSSHPNCDFPTEYKRVK